MKLKFQKILPTLLLTLVVLGALIGVPDNAQATINAYRPGDTLEQINTKIRNVEDEIYSSRNRTGNLDLIKRQELLREKEKLLEEKNKLSPSPALDQELTNVQNQITETAAQSKAHPNSIHNVKQPVHVDSCDSIWTFTVNGCLKAIVSWVGAILVFIFTRITWFANELFNQAIDISVRTFSNYANMPAVKVSWGVIRDLVNMGFIFVLLYIAIGTMLELHGLDWKKLVPKLIIVALLVNFSMFFTRVIIDISNVTANQFYLAAAQGTTSSITVSGVKLTGSPDITTALFKNIKVFSTNWLTAKSIGEETSISIKSLTAGGTLDWKQILVGTFGAVALALVASFVLFTGAILFIIRTLRLLFLIILSPFAFFFFILPKTEGYAGKWFKTLMDDATFAPAFLIMIYVVTQITQQIGKAGKTDDGSVIFFLLIMGLLLGAIIVAKALGAAGAAGAMKLAGRTNAALAGGTLWGLKQARRLAVAGGAGAAGGVAALAGKGQGVRKFGITQLKNIGTDAEKAWKESGQSKIAKATKEFIKAPGQTFLIKTSDVMADQSEQFGVSGGFMGDTDKQRREAEKAKKDLEKDEKDKKEAEKVKKASETKEKIKDLNKKQGAEIKQLQDKHLAGTATPQDTTRMNSLLTDIRNTLKDILKDTDNKTKAKLGGEILSMPGVAGVLTPKDLNQVRRDSELTDEQADKMREDIVANRANNSAAAEYLELTPENRSFWNVPPAPRPQQPSPPPPRIITP